MLREVTRDIADVSSASAALLLREMTRLYGRGTPKTSDVMAALEKFYETAMMERRLAEANMASALLRRLMWLVIDEERPSRNVFGSDRVVIYDLSELGSVYLKTIYGLSILSKTYYHSMTEGQSQTLKTLVIAEEAQNYVRWRRMDEPPSIGERVVNELRAYGVGMVLISPDPMQIPLHMARDVATVVSTSPDNIKDIFRTAVPRQMRRIMAYVYYNGRLKTVPPPKPPRRPIDLKAETREEPTEEAREEPKETEEVQTPTPKQPETQAEETPIEQKATVESSGEPLEEAPRGM